MGHDDDADEGEEAGDEVAAGEGLGESDGAEDCSYEGDEEPDYGCFAEGEVVYGNWGWLVRGSGFGFGREIDFEVRGLELGFGNAYSIDRKDLGIQIVRGGRGDRGLWGCRMGNRGLGYTIGRLC